MYKIINVLEKVVTDAVDSVLPTLVGACTCEECRADIICLVLNQLKPRYVIHRYGEILSRAEFEGHQRRGEVVAAITKAVRKVQEKSHDKRPDHQGK